MDDIIKALVEAPLSTILVVGGIVFLCLAVVRQFVGKMEVSKERQKLAAIIGAVLVVSGVALHFISPGPSPEPTPIATPETVTPTSTYTATATPTSTSTSTPTATPETASPTSTSTHSPTATPAETMIDDFEAYRGDAELRAFYSIDCPENDASISLARAPNIYRGSQALALTYRIHNIVPTGGYTLTDYAGLMRNFGTARNWQGFNFLRFWVRSDGSSKDLVVQFHEASGEAWKCSTNLSTFGDKDFQLALDKNVFHLAEWTPAVDNEISLGSITGFSIYVGHAGEGDGTIYIDEIRVSE